MKYSSLLVPVLAAAALAALSDTPSPITHLWRSAPRNGGSTPQVDPPWLTQGAGDGALGLGDVHATHAHLHGGEHEAGDPHLGLHAATDPHAAAHASDDPHAALYATGDPHAALHGAAGDPHGAAHLHADPHAGADPHGAAHLHADPHAGADPHGARASAAAPAVGAVERSSAANGRTVAEVFAQRSTLAEQRVSVRATVVKATDGVLGKTYLHLQDGSGSPQLETHDLTATTTEAFEIGETVEVEGVLAIDQDVGLDYRYPALLSDVKRVR